MMDWKQRYDRWSPRMLSIMRMIVALLFMQHGGQKLLGIPGTPPFHTVRLFSLMGLAGVLELFGGLLLLIGTYTRTVAFILLAEMIVAYFLAHASHGFWPLVNHGELALLYGSVFLYIIVAGGGDWSLDTAIKKKEPASPPSPPSEL
jgi:putative oxidoreductase